jgi:transcriptional regulator with XRE-family HTH domain
MGELLERAIRRKGLNITEIASAMNVTRRTLYNWFKQEIIDKDTMAKLSSIVTYDVVSSKPKTTIYKIEDGQTPIKDEAYWQDRYIDLLERYSSLIAENTSKH